MELENLTEEDLSNQEKVNLYEIDFNKIDVDAKKHYVVNVVSGMLYSIEAETYQKKAYHTPRIGLEVDENGRIIEEVEQELNIKEPGNYEIIINANEIVKWQSIEVVYNKFVEGTTTTVSKTSNDLYNWTEVSLQDAILTDVEEKFVISKAENTQYIKISINLQENASGKNSEIYYIKVKYYKFQKTDIKPEIKNSGADVIGGIYTVPTSPSGNGQTEAKGTATVTQTVTLPAGDESYILDLKEYGNPSTTVTITKPDGTVQTITGDELKTTEILGGSTVTITTQLNAGDGVEEVQVLKKDNKLNSTTAGITLSTTPEEWNTVEQKQYMYSNGGRGFWEKCFINNVAVGSAGILEKDSDRRIQVQYQTSIDGTEWSEPFTDLNEAENKRYLKILVNYQTKNNVAYGDTTQDKVTVMINDGYWTATFKDTDGTVLVSQKAYYINSSKQAKITTISTAPSKTGKSFFDWLVGSTPVAINTEYTMTGNTEFVAEYMPLEIYTVADLVEFRDVVNHGATCEGLTINLMADLDLSSVCSSTLGSSWVPIGNFGDDGNLYFGGNFKGNGYTISNIYINNSKSYQGLFGCVKNGSIDGLKTQGSVTGDSYVGGIVAIIYGADEYTISNCQSNVVLTATGFAGGIVGMIDKYSTVNIDYASNSGNITVNNNCAGGIVGLTGGWSGGYSTVNIDHVSNSGNVQANYDLAGGIVGVTFGGAEESYLTVNSAYNSGNIYAKHFSAGGILGGLWSSSEATINNSYNTGTIMTTSGGLGGIAGNIDGNGAK